jgi:nucleoside-diphosphate-sugar epimerase
MKITKMLLSTIVTVLAVFLMAAANPNAKGQVYNLGGSEVTGLKELAKRMVEINGDGEYQVCDFPADRRAIDIGDYYADFSKIRAELGWTPKRSLGETIGTVLDYYRQCIAHYL